MVNVVKTEIGKLLTCLGKIQVENPRQAERRAAYLEQVQLLKARKYDEKKESEGDGGDHEARAEVVAQCSGNCEGAGERCQDHPGRYWTRLAHL